MHITIGICTRDRADNIAPVLCSVLNSTYTDFDIIVVDQSASDDTARAMERIAHGDARVTCIRSATAGKSAALNIIIAQARGPVIAFTDDDCEVSPDWLRLIAGHFRENPDVALICGAVHRGPHDPSRGFIPDCPITRVTRFSSPWSKWRERGIGANMAFRLHVLRAVGPFDTMLGPGGPLYAGEDFDIAYRTLKAGYTVLDVPDACVVHHGFRTWTQGQILMRRTGLALGALYVKHLRLGDTAVLPTLVHDGLYCISWKRLLTVRPHNGLARFAAFVLGCAISFQFRLDHRRQVYAGRRQWSPICDTAWRGDVQGTSLPHNNMCRSKSRNRKLPR